MKDKIAATTKILTSAISKKKSQPSRMSWSHRKRGNVQRTHMKRKIRMATFPKKTAMLFFDELFKLAIKETKGAGKFVIPGLGRAVKAHRKARMGRNPATGEAIKIKAKTVVRLRASKAFKDAVLK